MSHDHVIEQQEPHFVTAVARRGIAAGNTEPSEDFKRGARAASEAMGLYFLNENEAPMYADLSVAVLEGHAAGAYNDALMDESHRLGDQPGHQSTITEGD